MAPKPPTVKSVVRRVTPTLEKVGEPAVLSASLMPTLANGESEAIPLSATASPVKSRVERVETCVEKRDTSMQAKQRAAFFDPQATKVLDFANSQTPAFLPLAWPPPPQGTPPNPIVSQRDPLGLLDRHGIRSSRTAQIIQCRTRIRIEFRPASNEWEDVG